MIFREQPPPSRLPRWQSVIHHLAAVHGKISELSDMSPAGSLTITSSCGESVTINMRPTTKVNRDRHSAPLSELRPNDFVAAAFDANNNAIAIEVYSPKYFDDMGKRSLLS